MRRADDAGGDEGRDEIDVQPGQARAHGKRHARKGALLPARADHRLDVGGDVLPRGLHQHVFADHAEQQRFLVEYAADFLIALFGSESEAAAAMAWLNVSSG